MHVYPVLSLQLYVSLGSRPFRNEERVWQIQRISLYLEHLRVNSVTTPICFIHVDRVHGHRRGHGTGCSKSSEIRCKLHKSRAAECLNCVVITRCAYAQGRVKHSIYMCNVCCVCVGKKHGCLLSYRSKIAISTKT